MAVAAACTPAETLLVEPTIDARAWANDYIAHGPLVPARPPSPFEAFGPTAKVIASLRVAWTEAGHGQRVASDPLLPEPWIDAASRLACTVRGCENDCTAAIEPLHRKCGTARLPGTVPIALQSTGCDSDRHYDYDVHIWPPHATIRR